jgi:hypothetical protein
MRCDEVVRELAAPTADRDRAAMAGHLAGCSACAEWARRAEGLDRLWEATRPAEPSPEAWDAVWANIAQALPRPASARPEDPPATGVAPSRNGSGPKFLVHAGPEPAPASVPTGPRTRGRAFQLAAVALVGLAQAAAILVALGLAWRTQPHPVGTRKPPVIVPDRTLPAVPVAIRSEKEVKVKAEIEGGSMVVIYVDEKVGRVVDRTPPEMNVGVDTGMEMTNIMESIATPQVAAR